MKPPIVFHFGWAAIAVCTFAAGYLAASSTVSPPAEGRSVNGMPSGASVDRTPHPSTATFGSPNSAEASPAKTLSPNDARERGFRVVMDRATRVARMRNLCDLLDSISPENWRQVLDGFETALRSQGEEGGEAYNLLLEQIGAIGGAEAMEDALAPEKVSVRGRAITILKGWANADPKGCVAWFDKQSPEIQDRYAGQMVAGLARVDPKTALEVTFRPGKAYYLVGTVNAVINNAVSVMGVEGVEDIFATMRGRQDLPANAKHVFFAKLAEKKLDAALKTGETATQVLLWFDSHVGRDYVDAKDSMRIVSLAAKASPEDTLSWLDIQMDRLTAEQAKASYHELGRELQKQTPKTLTEWLTANPSHSQRDNMMEAAVGNLLSAGNYDGASHMAAAIGNEEARSRVMGVVTQRIKKSEAEQ